MKIYGIDDKVLLEAVITSNAQHEEEMMKSDFVRLSWRTNVHKTIPVGAYIIPFTNGLKYRLIEPYEPQQDAEDTFTYQPEFQHPKMWLSKVPFTYATKNTLGEDTVQQEWEFTGPTATILQYVVDFINTTFGFTGNDKFVLSLQGSIDTNVSLQFSNTDVLSAITAIANACTENKCEWHLSWEQKALYFGQISINLEEEIPTLKVGENIGKASISESSEGYYNVFSPQGSTRNMSVKAASGEYVSTGIRLRLNKKKYPNGEIDTRTDINEPKQTLALAFDDIYPHVDCYVYNVRKRTRFLLDEQNHKVVSEYNTDGSVKAYKTYTVWYMRLAYPLTAKKKDNEPIATTKEKLNGKEQILYWYDYVVEDSQIIDGFTLCGSFSVNTNEGALASSLVAQPSSGDGFELIYHKVSQTIPASENTGDSGVNILAGDYEIIFSNENDTIIPTNENEGLIPRGGSTPSIKNNIVILYNIAMGDDEIEAAQDELEKETLEEIEYRHSDLKNYSFSAYPNKFAESNPHLYIGQRVVYDNGNGYSYTTRVLKLVTNLDYDICQDITVGNATIKGSISQLKEDVKGLIQGTISVGSGLSYEQVVSIVKNYVAPRYLSRLYDDITQGHLTINGGARILKGTETDNIQSSDYQHAGFPFGKGFNLSNDDGSQASVLEIDKLFVRMKAVFAELEIRKLSYVGGNYLFSAAGGKVYYVEWIDANDNILEKTKANASLVYAYRCYMYSDDGTTATQNLFKVDDQVRCQNFDIDGGTSTGNGSVPLSNAGNHYWWRRVNAIGSGQIKAKGDGVTYQYVDFLNAAGQYGDDSDVPEEGDTMVQFGSWTDEERQGAILIVVEGEMTPAIIEYTEVGANAKHFIMPDPYTQICANPKYGNILRGKFISIADGSSASGTIEEQINSLIDQLNDVKNQADQKFDVWFGSGAPRPNSILDKATNAPASDWTTDAAKALHAQDLYYDTDKDPASDGGRAWRWTATTVKVQSVEGKDVTITQYFWEEVTDQDTIDALEKAADLQNQVNDISSDCVISAGSEKSQLLKDWNEVAATYKSLSTQVSKAFGSNISQSGFPNLYTAFMTLAQMLNGGEKYTSNDYSAIPKWIGDDFEKDTYLADYTENSNTKGVSKSTYTSSSYRSIWKSWYEALVAVQASLSAKTDPRNAIAAMAEKIYDISGGYIESGNIKVFLGMEGNTTCDGYIRYYNSAVSRYSDGAWSTLNNDGYNVAFDAVYNAIGIYGITVSKAKTTSPSKYDLVIRKVYYSDKYQQKSVEGNIEILMYNGSAWEMLRESTRAIIENLGDEIRGVVYGSDGKGGDIASGIKSVKGLTQLFSDKFTFDENGNVTNIDRSGVVATTDFNKWLTDTYGTDKSAFQEALNGKMDAESFAYMYAQAVASDGTIVKSSSMSVYVTKDDEGYISNAKIKADNIELEGLVTANNNFKILSDGSVTIANGTFLCGTDDAYIAITKYSDSDGSWSVLRLHNKAIEDNNHFEYIGEWETKYGNLNIYYPGYHFYVGDDGISYLASWEDINGKHNNECVFGVSAGGTYITLNGAQTDVRGYMRLCEETSTLSGGKFLILSPDQLIIKYVDGKYHPFKFGQTSDEKYNGMLGVDTSKTITL